MSSMNVNSDEVRNVGNNCRKIGDSVDEDIKKVDSAAEEMATSVVFPGSDSLLNVMNKLSGSAKSFQTDVYTVGTGMKKVGDTIDEVTETLKSI